MIILPCDNNYYQLTTKFKIILVSLRFLAKSKSNLCLKIRTNMFNINLYLMKTKNQQVYLNLDPTKV